MRIKLRVAPKLPVNSSVFPFILNIFFNQVKGFIVLVLDLKELSMRFATLLGGMGRRGRQDLWFIFHRTAVMETYGVQLICYNSLQSLRKSHVQKVTSRGTAKTTYYRIRGSCVQTPDRLTPLCVNASYMDCFKPSSHLMCYFYALWSFKVNKKK